MSLANISLYDLNLTANCSNLALGIDVWLNDFYSLSPRLGKLDYDNDTYANETADSGPSSDDSGYSDYPWFWTNGTSPEWLGFWRSALASALPSSYMNFSDQEISDWSNTTEMFSFFDEYDNPLVHLPQMSFPPWLSKYVAAQGGCKPVLEPNATDSLVSMAQACMTQYCCSSTTNTTVTQNPNTGFPYHQKWTVQDTCSFHTCQQSNNGNPDLGGIGILVAYLIEGCLLGFSIIMFGIKMLTDSWRRKSPDVRRKFLDSHDFAVLESSGVFIDTSVFFALSICFAAIIFNFHGTPLLYEDKLGQVSTLLTIDAPIAILLLSYRRLNRKNLRIFVVLLAALMTFIIQFLFRRAKSFNPAANLCLNWDDTVDGFFRDRFTVKAVWACLLFVFFMWKIIPWHILRKPEAALKWEFKFNPRFQIWKKLPFWERIVNSSKLSKVSKLLVDIWNNMRRINFESFAAYILAVYALYDIFYDIRFLIFLRSQEKLISMSADNSENQWGYGQILAVFVWVPVIVEYTYVLGWKLGFYRAVGRNLFALGCRIGLYTEDAERESLAAPEYQMVEQHVVPKGDGSLEPPCRNVHNR